MSAKDGVKVKLAVTVVDRQNKSVLMDELVYDLFVRPEQHAYHHRFVLEVMVEALAKIAAYRLIATASTSNPLYNNAVSGKDWTVETKVIETEIIF
jgi:hypothetical protein